MNHVGGVMITVLNLKCSRLWVLGQTKDYKDGIGYYSAKHASLTRKSNSNVIFFMDNIFVQFGGLVFQTICIPVGTNCAPLLADL